MIGEFVFIALVALWFISGWITAKAMLLDVKNEGYDPSGVYVAFAILLTLMGFISWLSGWFVVTEEMVKVHGLSRVPHPRFDITKLTKFWGE